MSWSTMMAFALVGLAGSMVAVVLTVYQGIRYRKWLPKRDVVERLEALKLQVEEKEVEYENLREDLFQARTDITQGQELRKWMDATKDETSQLENRRKELEDCEGELTGLQEELAACDARLTQGRQDEAALQAQLDRQRKELLPEEVLLAMKADEQKLSWDVTNLTSQVQALNGQVDALTLQKSEAKEELNGLQERVDTARIEERRLREEVAGMEVLRDKLSEQIDFLKQASVEAARTSGATNLDESAKLLWEAMWTKDRGDKSLSESLKEEAALEHAEVLIRESGLIYDKRVLRSFHTALKCSEEAPLLVLAGISGTGKSALPTRYADAMGMHFLNVPVQPGWDSPADLLGFYNHLEGRFRPTELTRAILQMDYVHKAGKDGEALRSEQWPHTADARENLSDRMLLVLLDEMNLARVEYYFSEFLSRLENRRGVDPLKDRKARERAEFVLDLGAAGEGRRQNLSTYVGKNVLFVGTMNEDESTQTLSDKVVDRSNVMRFGRPANLEFGDAKPSPKGASGYLPLKAWQKWVEMPHELSEADRRRVHQWIIEVNACLTMVGRPFAHRAAKAIHMYIRQYPDHTEQGLRDAFSDQVELRILPRLRGLDIHEASALAAVDRVTRLVENELQDEKLTGALKEARTMSRDQLFQWHGVDRLAGALTVH